MKVAFYTLGCKVNQYETNVIQNMFQNDGFEVVDFTDFADVYVINTCTVTGISDRKSRQILRRAKQVNKDAIVCAIGCYAQVAKEDIEKIEEVDIVLGTGEKRELLNAVKEELQNRKKVIKVENVLKIHPYEEYDGVAFTDHVRAEVKIQDGCDRFCTYCIIPYARGAVRSRQPENVLNEIRKLAESGTKEVVITGIHVSSYGKDFEEDKREDALINLLERINEIEGIERIRLGSLEPLIITEDFVSRLTKISKMCNHFHLSLQSGCDETLERMNRQYTTKEFEHIVNLLRDNIPDVALTTDIIVGFPGETENEFEKTKLFLKKIIFSKMHIFKYSKRKGTKASLMKNQVDDETKEIRSNELLEMSANNENSFATNYVGKEIEVLFENEKEGHTKNYIKIELKKPNKNYINKIIKIIPEKCENGILYC